MPKKKSPPAKPLIVYDIAVQDHGSVAMLEGLTTDGKEWLEENIHVESWQRFGGGIACEPRMVAAVVEAARDAGLEVQL